MPARFRRVAVLGVTALGTWAVVPVAAPAADNASPPPAHTAKAITPASPAYRSQRARPLAAAISQRTARRP
jgi:hypothetical protein